MTTTPQELKVRDWLRAARQNPHETAVPPEKLAEARWRNRVLGLLIRRRRKAAGC
jgi:hypothetical protein